MSGFPTVLAKHLQQMLLHARADLPPALGDRYFEALPADVVQLIESSAPLAWLPVRASVALADTLLATVGPKRTHECYAASLPRVLRTPRWAPIVTTGIRLLGLSPGSFARWADKGWDGMYRDCGTVAGSVDDANHARIVYEALPEEVRGSRAWIDSLPSGAEGILTICEVRGSVRLDQRRLEEGTVVVHLAWE